MASLPPEASTPDGDPNSSSSDGSDSSSDDELENPNLDRGKPPAEESSFNEPHPSAPSPEPPAAPPSPSQPPAKRQKFAREPTVHPAPKTDQAVHTGSVVNGAPVNPSSTLAPVSSINPHIFYLTAQQLRIKNKKLPKGYSFVPYNKVPNIPIAAPLTPSFGATLGDSAVGKRKRKKKALDVEPSPVSASKRQKTDPKKSKKKKTTQEKQRAQEQTAKQRQREKEKQLQDQSQLSQGIDTESRIEVLKARLEFLKAKKAAVSGLPAATTTSGKKTSGKKAPKSTPKASKTKKAPKSPKPATQPSTPHSYTKNGRVTRPPAKLVETILDSKPLADFVRYCLEVLDYLAKQQNCRIFSVPVDWESLKIPTYPDIIKTPMDLGSIRTKLLSSQYPSHLDFAADVRLVWNNATTFNPPTHFVHTTAKHLSGLFEQKYAKVIAKMAKVKSASRTNKTPASKKGKNKGTVSASVVEELRSEFASQIVALKAQVQSAHKTKPQKAKPEVELTQREKQQLKSDIFQIPSNKLSPLVKIIQRNNPNIGNEDGDGLEFDINQLSTATLRELQRYVKRELTAKKRNQQRFTPGRSTPGRMSSPSTTPLPSLPPVHTAPPPARSILASPPALEARTPTTTTGIAPVPKPVAIPEPKPVTTKKEFTEDDDSSSSSSDSSSDDSDSDDDDSSIPKVKNEVKPSAEVPVASVAPVAASTTPVVNAVAPFAPAAPAQPSFGDPGAFSASITEMQVPPVTSELEPAPQTLQPNFNPSAWSGLVSQAPKSPVAKLNPSTNPNGKDVLWTDFQSKDQEMKEKAKQLADQQARQEEEAARKAAEKAAEIEAEQARQRAEAEKAALLAEEKAKKRVEEERVAEQRRREEEARETARRQEEQGETVNFGTGSVMDDLQNLLDT